MRLRECESYTYITRTHPSHVATSLVAELILSPTFMSRFRKSKPPVDISVSTPSPPLELVQSLTSRRNPRALAVSSTAIALSIGVGSAFHDTHETSSADAAVRGGDTAWQTACGAARMAIEIAKESSDMFPPLKAVASAVFVLIRNYDVSASLLRPRHLLILRSPPAPANVG